MSIVWDLRIASERMVLEKKNALCILAERTENLNNGGKIVSSA